MLYDTAVYIGRFQPVHNAHVEIMQRALAQASHLIIVLGSAYQPRTYKNPFHAYDRELMIKASLSEAGVDSYRYTILYLKDNRYDNQAWAKSVQELLQPFVGTGKIALIGHKKDESSFYLDMFPQWGFIDVPLIEPLAATDIRELLFKTVPNLNFIKSVVPKSVLEFLGEFIHTQEFRDICAEREFVLKYQAQFASLPYKPVFVTVDAVVIQSAHVLMVRRRSYPGKGLLALPGGFLDADSDSSVQSAAIRELKEETGIKVPEKVLIGSIVANKVFDAKDRSTRGRTITHAFKFDLGAGALPKVRGGDDAEKALWVPLAKLNSSECYEDHYDIIKALH